MQPKPHLAALSHASILDHLVIRGRSALGTSHELRLVILRNRRTKDQMLCSVLACKRLCFEGVSGWSAGIRRQSYAAVAADASPEAGSDLEMFCTLVQTGQHRP